MPIRKKLSDKEPLKVLSMNYLLAIIDPECKLSTDTWKKAQSVLFKMIDASYQTGVSHAHEVIQKTVWEIQSNQSHWVDLIQSACKETSEWTEELRNRELETPIELDKFHKIGYPEILEDIDDI
jgi:hypothetical protein